LEYETTSAENRQKVSQGTNKTKKSFHSWLARTHICNIVGSGIPNLRHFPIDDIVLLSELASIKGRTFLRLSCGGLWTTRPLGLTIIIDSAFPVWCWQRPEDFLDDRHVPHGFPNISILVVRTKHLLFVFPKFERGGSSTS
jgi:hypothetical protein